MLAIALETINAYLILKCVFLGLYCNSAPASILTSPNCLSWWIHNYDSTVKH